MAVYIQRTEVNSDSSPIILWDNTFKTGTVTATGETVGGEAENAIDDNTYDFWIPGGVPTALESVFGGNVTMSYAAVAAHTLGTNGNTLSVQYGTGGGSWVEITNVTPTDDSTIFIAFEETTADSFRFVVSGGTGPSVGVVFMGQAIRFDSGILPSYTPLYMAEEIELLVNKSMSGQFFGNRVIRKAALSNFSLNILDRSFVEGADFQNFRDHYNDGKPFFFASNPSELEDDTAYCWRQVGGELNPTFGNDGIFYNVDLSLEAYIG